VLREDRQFRLYQRWQMLNGIAFMMSTPALLYMVSKEMTDPTEEYVLANIIVQTIPMVTMLIFTQVWAPLFDRVHVTVFRTWHSAVGVLGLIAILWGALRGNGPEALAIVAVGQFLVGIAHAGGGIAWNLGHNDFASLDKASTYMGVHVMLTGLRGCVAPFVGAWLYQIPQVGRNIFGIGIVFAFVAMLGFWSMARGAPKKSVAKVKERELAKV
jgi:MFS family permease